MTGFECPGIFVIRRSDNRNTRKRGPPLIPKTSLGLKNVIDEFPNRPMRQYSFIFLKSKIRNESETDKYFSVFFHPKRPVMLYNSFLIL